MTVAILVSQNDQLSGYYVSLDVLMEAMHSANSTGSLEETVDLITNYGTEYDPELNNEGDDIFVDVSSGDPLDFVEDAWNILSNDVVSQITMGQDHG